MNSILSYYIEIFGFKDNQARMLNAPAISAIESALVTLIAKTLWASYGGGIHLNYTKVGASATNSQPSGSNLFLAIHAILTVSVSLPPFVAVVCGACI